MTWDDAEFLIFIGLMFAFIIGVIVGYLWGAAETIKMKGIEDD